MSIAAFFLMSGLILIIVLECTNAGEPHPYIPKRHRPPKSLWIKSLLKAMSWCAATLVKVTTNNKVRCRHQRRGHRSVGQCYRCETCPCNHCNFIPIMTTTWANRIMKTLPLGKQFDSDSEALMLDDGASACITNDKDDFIEPPQCKVRGIKGHAKATHHSTLKWHIEDDNGLVHVMVIKGAYLIPDTATRILSPQQASSATRR